MANNDKTLSPLKTAGIFITIFISISSSSLLVLLSGATAVSCAFWRVVIASLILWCVWFLRNGLRRPSISRELAVYSMVAGVLLAVHFLLWMESLFIIPVGVSTTVVVTYPLLSVLIDHFLFKEKPTFLQVLGLSVGLIGVLFFMHPGVLAGYDSYGVLLSFGGALGATGYFSIGRFVRKKTNLLNYTTLAYTSTAITLVLYALVSGENLLNHSLQTYTYFSLLAILPMIGGHTLINYVLRYLKTSVATSIALGEPVGASMLAYFILDQPLDLPKALVMTLVLASIALTVSQEANAKTRHIT